MVYILIIIFKKVILILFVFVIIKIKVMVVFFLDVYVLL